MLVALIESVREGPGTLYPFEPVTADLGAYTGAAHVLMDGGDFYTVQQALFPYIYPPITAILAIGLALLPWEIAQIVWTMAQGALVLAVLRRIGFQMLPAALLAAFALPLVEPLRNTIELGQMGIVLLALVTHDLVAPGPRADGSARRRLLPAGVATGLATGIKLTPAVFLIHLWLIGRRRDAYVGVATFLGTVAVGFLVAPTRAWGYWSRLAAGDSGANPDGYGWIANISVVSATQRFLDVERGSVVGLALSVALVLAGLAAARLAHRAGQPLLALGILGLASALANPIAWEHHLTWVVLLLAGVAPWIDVSKRVGGDVAHQPVPVPAALTVLIVIVTLALITMPQFKLGGAPHAVQEIHHFSVWQKLIAATPDILVGVLTLAVVAWGIRAGRSRRSRPEPMESDIS